MSREVFIYFEGDRLLKSGFDQFFRELHDRAQEKRWKIHFVYGKNNPERDFRLGIQRHPGALNVLLKDSEGPYSQNAAAEICRKNGLGKFHAAWIFWMVEMMEAWFFADKGALRRFYGATLKESALIANPRVEQIGQKDLKASLHEATKNTDKGDYFDHKATHGSKLLELLNPGLVRTAAPNCRKLFDAVLARLGEES